MVGDKAVGKSELAKCFAVRVRLRTYFCVEQLKVMSFPPGSVAVHGAFTG